MSFDAISELNWLAVIVGGLIYFALGALWYSPAVFGRPWQRAIGWDPERTPPEMNAATYAVPAIAYTVIAIAIALLARATGSNDVGTGLVLGLVVGIGISVMHTLGDAVFDPNRPAPWTWFAITAGYHAVGQLIVGLVVSVWR
ncbi:MAG: DUF1761 domain-containing protein [Candidatus Limnocylindria bacterium]